MAEMELSALPEAGSFELNQVFFFVSVAPLMYSELAFTSGVAHMTTASGVSHIKCES